jgi:uncharacterized protein
MKPIDCQTCGACCVANRPDNTKWVSLNPEEVDTIPSRMTRKTHRIHDDWAMELDGNGRCTALRGDLGVSCSCAIYDRRPEVCWNFERGSKDCRDLRRRHLGIEVRSSSTEPHQQRIISATFGP